MVRKYVNRKKNIKTDNGNKEGKGMLIAYYGSKKN